MKNVVSYSLFWAGKDDHAKLYTNGLRATVLAHHNIYPGWELRIHHDGTLHLDKDSERLIAFAELGLVKLVHVKPATRICEAMLWRMLPVFDQSVGYTLCRDLDSLVIPRERLMTEDFIKSGAGMHCINDHPQHGAPIMGGMCSFKGDIFRRLTDKDSFERLIAGFSLDSHGDDQDLLMARIWPVMQHSLCEHRISGREQTPGAMASFKYTSTKESEIKDITDAVRDRADMLIPFLGVPGFDYKRVEEFFLKEGHPQISKLVNSIP